MALVQLVITETVTKIAYVEKDRVQPLATNEQLAQLALANERKGISSEVTVRTVEKVNAYQADGITEYPRYSVVVR